MRAYRTFAWRDSNFRICSPAFDEITAEIVRQRELLERYIARFPAFRTAMVPVGAESGAPPIVLRMVRAAALVGVGPMAAVAGAIAQFAAEAAVRSGAAEAVVDNGGDLFVTSDREVRVGLFTGMGHRLSGRLAFVVPPAAMPLAVCSSSGRMGHSQSLGDADLATVVAGDAALADAAATLACNLVRTAQDVDEALQRVAGIPGIAGVLLIKGDRVGLGGKLPELVRGPGRDVGRKVTRDPRSRELDGIQ